MSKVPHLLIVLAIVIATLTTLMAIAQIARASHSTCSPNHTVVRVFLSLAEICQEMCVPPGAQRIGWSPHIR